MLKNREINNIVPKVPPPAGGPPDEVPARLPGALCPGISMLRGLWHAAPRGDQAPRGSGGLPGCVSPGHGGGMCGWLWGATQLGCGGTVTQAQEGRPGPA